MADARAPVAPGAETITFARETLAEQKAKAEQAAAEKEQQRLEQEHVVVAAAEKRRIEQERVAAEAKRKAGEAARQRGAALGGDMVRIAGGCFQMGSPSYEFGRDDDEGQHRVCVDAFAIGAHEVTFDAYDRFTRATSKNRADDEGWGRGRRPVINVSWHDATAYAEWLSGQPRRMW